MKIAARCVWILGNKNSDKLGYQGCQEKIKNVHNDNVIVILKKILTVVTLVRCNQFLAKYCQL